MIHGCMLRANVGGLQAAQRRYWEVCMNIRALAPRVVGTLAATCWLLSGQPTTARTTYVLPGFVIDASCSRHVTAIDNCESSRMRRTSRGVSSVRKPPPCFRTPPRIRTGVMVFPTPAMPPVSPPS